jgi:hypothetical protein
LERSNHIEPSNISFRLILGHRIRIRREKIFRTTPWASHINIFNYKPSTGLWSGPIFFLDGFEFYDPKLP